MNKEDRKICLIPSTNEENNSFVGIRITNNRVEFHYPETYDISGVDDLLSISDIKLFRLDMIDILHTLSLAKTRSTAIQKADDGAFYTKNFSLLSYLWIIRDYFSNGIYKNTEKKYRNNAKGKINWKRTLLSKPIISNGNSIYNNLVTEVNNDCDTIISAAHKLCLYYSVRNIGWLFGLNEKAFRVSSVTDSILKKYTNSIRTEIKNTFDDVKKARLIHMSKILSGVDDSKKISEIVYGVDNYHYVYERMVNSVFGNVIDIKKYNPNASWFIKKHNGKYEKKEASALRPDTIRIESAAENTLDNDPKKTAYIIDAKFYRYGVTADVNDLPETTSIQKQITYATHIKSNFKKEDNIEDIHNVFVMPYNKNNNKLGYASDLEYIGFSKANWVDDNIDGVVHAFLIDTKHLVSSWSHGNCREDIKKMINDIEKYQENNDHLDYTLC